MWWRKKHEPSQPKRTLAPATRADLLAEAVRIQLKDADELMIRLQEQIAEMQREAEKYRA